MIPERQVSCLDIRPQSITGDLHKDIKQGGAPPEGGVPWTTDGTPDLLYGEVHTDFLNRLCRTSCGP